MRHDAARARAVGLRRFAHSRNADTNGRRIFVCSCDVHRRNLPAAFEGRILFGNRDTFFLANADGSGVERSPIPASIAASERISPDHSRILTMPGTDQTGSVTGGTLTLQQPHFDRVPVGDSTLNLVPQVWSPDGVRIAFEGWTFRPESDWDLRLPQPGGGRYVTGHDCRGPCARHPTRLLT